MHPAEAVLNEPWPESREERQPPENEDSLTEEEQARSKWERASIREENARRRRELLEQKKSACPLLTLSLSAPEAQVAKNGRISFTACLHYEGVPVGDEIPIVAKILGSSEGPLGDRAVEYGQYQIFAQPDCSPESLVPYSTTYITVRRARGPDGRFLPLPDRTEEITEENGWSEMQVGDSISRDFVLDLEGNRGWQDNLRRGTAYWLAYAPPGKMPFQRSELRLWRFGSIQSWKGKGFDLGDKRWIGIPIGKSNAIEFTF